MAVVPEQGRLLAQMLPAGHAWSFREQIATSLMHQGAQAAAEVVLRATSGGGVLLCDGTVATPAVWHLCACTARPGYDSGAESFTQTLLAAVDANAYDLTMLLAPDIPWEPDGIRDDPGGRDQAFERYRRLYPDAVVVAGPQRLDAGITLLSDMLNR